MATKAAIKDVGRAMGIPYPDVDRIGKNGAHGAKHFYRSSDQKIPRSCSRFMKATHKSPDDRHRQKSWKG